MWSDWHHCWLAIKQNSGGRFKLGLEQEPPLSQDPMEDNP